MISDDDVDVEAGGKERDTHISVLFGFEYGMDTKPLKKFLSEQSPFYATLGPIGVFRKVKKGYKAQEDDDGSGVLKVEVESEHLENLHYALREEFGEQVKVTFPDYKPHLTLAYLKAGAKAFDLEGSTKFSGETYYFNELIFSHGTSAHRSTVTMKLGEIGESVRRLLG